VPKICVGKPLFFRLEPGREQLLNELTELASGAFTQEGDTYIAVGPAPDVRCDLLEVWITPLSWGPTPTA